MAWCGKCTLTDLTSSGEKGLDWQVQIFLEDERGPMNLNGYEFVMKVYDRKDGTELLELADPDEIEVDPSAGMVELNCPYTTIGSLAWRRGYHEISWTAASGRPGCLFEGTVRVSS